MLLLFVPQRVQGGLRLRLYGENPLYRLRREGAKADGTLQGRRQIVIMVMGTQGEDLACLRLTLAMGGDQG